MRIRRIDVKCDLPMRSKRRVLRVGSHGIFYRIDVDAVRVIRITHEHMIGDTIDD